VAEVEPVPYAYGGGCWYAAGSPYPPGKADTDTPPTAATKARVRSMFVAFDGVIKVGSVGTVVKTKENRPKETIERY
jgi:hypothetical protein